MGLSKSTVHRLFQLFGLQPHRTRSFKLSADPFFVEELRDVVGFCVQASSPQGIDRHRALARRTGDRLERRRHLLFNTLRWGFRHSEWTATGHAYVRIGGKALRDTG